GCARLIVTSPPYNVGIEYGNGHNDRLSDEDYYKWCERWIAGCWHVLAPGGRLAINLPNVSNEAREKGLKLYSVRFWQLLLAQGFTAREQIVWVKSNTENDPNDF